MVHRWQNSPAFRPQGLTPSKVCDHDCFSHLLHFSASHTFFSDIVEETYNKNFSLCVYLKILSFNSMCCLQHCEEHYLDRGVRDEDRGLRILAAINKERKNKSGNNTYVLSFFVNSSAYKWTTETNTLKKIKLLL